jgi:hypothetical protein
MNNDGKLSEQLVMGHVWHSGTILSGEASNMPRRIRESLDQDLTAFAADYYKQNSN